jgi:hypothetical protein
VAARGVFVTLECRVVRFQPCKVVYRFKSPWHPCIWVMACLPRSNVVISTSYYCDDNYMDGDDNFVVMVYANHIALIPLHA